MKFHGIDVVEGAKITNLVVDSGTTFPTEPDTGELFYLTQGTVGLYLYTDTWTFVNAAGIPDIIEDGNSKVEVLSTNGSIAHVINNVEKMRLTSTGLGIGTTNPDQELHIEGTASAGAIAARITNTDISNSQSQAAIEFEIGSNIDGAIRVFNGSAGAEYMKFDIAGIEAARFNSNRYFGIGANPAFPLDVSNAAADIARFVCTDSGNTGVNIITKHDSVSPTNNDVIARYSFEGKNSAAETLNYAQVRVLISDTTDGSEDGVYEVRTTVGGTLGTDLRVAGRKLGVNTTNLTETLNVGGNILAEASSTTLIHSKTTQANGTALFAVENDAKRYDLRVNGVSDSFEIRDNTLAATRFSIDSAGSLAETFCTESRTTSAVGSLIKAKSTGANTLSTVAVENDAYNWGIRVNGGAGDQFEIVNFTDARIGLIIEADGTEVGLFADRVVLDGFVDTQSGGNTNSTIAIRVRNSDLTDLFAVRDDGLFYTGVDGLSPYNNTTSNAANVYVASDGALYRSTSSIRYKKDVVDYDKGIDALMSLRPVYYKDNRVDENRANETERQFAGLIAEEVHDSGLTEFVDYNKENQPDALHYGNMMALCIKTIQEQQEIIEDLKSRIETLESN